MRLLLILLFIFGCATEEQIVPPPEIPNQYTTTEIEKVQAELERESAVKSQPKKKSYKKRSRKKHHK